MAVKRVNTGQGVAAAARGLGVVEQTLRNWVKAAKVGRLNKGDGKVVTEEQMVFNSLKNERLHGTRYHTRDEARADLFDYIELFYNRKRSHSTLGYASPTEFMKNWVCGQAELERDA